MAHRASVTIEKGYGNGAGERVAQCLQIGLDAGADLDAVHAAVMHGDQFAPQRLLRLVNREGLVA